MKRRNPITVRLTVSGDELLEASLANLKGRPFRGFLGGEKFAETQDRFGQRMPSRIFAEAIFAVEDFFEKNGYIPTEMRFELTSADPFCFTGVPSTVESRRAERLREMEVIERTLAAQGGAS